MGLDALFASHADLIRDPERHGTEGVYLDYSAIPTTRTDVTGVFEILGLDPLVKGQAGDTVMEQAQYDLPLTPVINMNGAFEVDGQLWKITGLAGRDTDTQSITCQRPVILNKRQAQRRG